MELNFAIRWQWMNSRTMLPAMGQWFGSGLDERAMPGNEKWEADGFGCPVWREKLEENCKFFL
jgi:hypothetical protein